MSSIIGPHCQYILLAEFDIDKGSTIRRQYPQETGLEESKLAELMLPEGVHLRENDFTTFFIKFSDLKNFKRPETATDEFLCCMNAVRNKHDSSAKRGAVVKAMALCTVYKYFHLFKPLLLLALDKFYSSGDENILKSVYNVINGLSLNEIPKLRGIDMRIMSASRLRLLNQSSDVPRLKYETKIEWDDLCMPFRVNIGMECDEVGEANVVNLIATFKENIMIIYYAILCQKRVLFIGHNQPTHQLCIHVLSSVLLVCPPLKGLLKRCYPYANLTHLEFLEDDGYIAGVSNPIFEQRKKWWDVCCNIQSGEITIAPGYRKVLNQLSEEKQQIKLLLDEQFTDDLLQGVELKYGEEWARCKFRDLTMHLLSMANNTEVFSDSKSREKEMQAYSFTIDLLKETAQYKNYLLDIEQLDRASPFRSMTAIIKQHVRSLHVRNPSIVEMEGIFNDLVRYVSTEQELLEFLSMWQESQGGLVPLAKNLFHRSSQVRQATVELLKRLDELKEGTSCVTQLNFFLLLTYHRLKHYYENNDDDDDDNDMMVDDSYLGPILQRTDTSLSVDIPDISNLAMDESPRPISPNRLPPQPPDSDSD